MPYITILTGHPCSGKSTLAKTIRDRAIVTQSESIDKVIIVDELTANTTITDPSQIAPLCYQSSSTEKVLRNTLKSTFDRVVATAVHDEMEVTTTTTTKKRKKTLIILDSTNYIKGYRYELYCICKAATSNYCVVWCLNDINTVKEWNQQRRTNAAILLSDNNNNNNPTTTTNSSSNTYNNNNNYYYYTDEILNALILRYEPPDARHRWDYPLYQIDLRSPIVQQLLQKNTTTTTTTTGIAEQLLQQSLYNMHNLSEALATTTTTTTTTSSTTIIGPSNDDTIVNAAPINTVKEGSTTLVKVDVPKNKASSTFKRSAFQKKRTTNPSSNPTSSSSSSSSLSTTKPMTLTAEALSSFDRSNTLSTSSEPLEGTATTNNNVTSRKSKVQPSMNIESRHQGHRTMVEQVDDFLLQFICHTQPLKESTSTRQHRSVESDILHNVDTITQQLCTILHDIIRSDNINVNSTTMDRIPIPFQNHIWYLDCSTTGNKNTTNSNPQQISHDMLASLETLREIRTKYVLWIRKNPIEELATTSTNNSTKVIIESFLSYITTQIQQSR